IRMESRLLRHTNLLPERAVVRDHRFAEDRAQTVEVFHVVVDLSDEHALEMIGLREEDHALIGHGHGDDAAIALCELLQDRHRVRRSALLQGGQLEPDALLLPEALRVLAWRCGISLLQTIIGRRMDRSHSVRSYYPRAMN